MTQISCFKVVAPFYVRTKETVVPSVSASIFTGSVGLDVSSSISRFGKRGLVFWIVIL